MKLPLAQLCVRLHALYLLLFWWYNFCFKPPFFSNLIQSQHSWLALDLKTKYCSSQDSFETFSGPFLLIKMCPNLPSISKTLKGFIDIFRRDIFKNYLKSNFNWKDAANSYLGFFDKSIILFWHNFVYFDSQTKIRFDLIKTNRVNFVKKIQESGVLDSRFLGFGVWSNEKVIVNQWQLKNIRWFLTDPAQYPKIKTMQSNLVFPRQYRRTTARRGLCMNNALKSTFITSNVYNYHISQNLTINGVVMDGNWTDFSELYFLCAFLWLVFLVIDILMYHGQTNRVKSRWFESMSHDKWIGI